MGKKVTLQDIATAAGVSKASVSMILKRRAIESFNKDTVDKVYKLAAELGYKSVNGQTFRLGKVTRDEIMLIVPYLLNPYYTMLVQSIESAARQKGYTTFTLTTYLDVERERAFLQQAKTENVAGVIFCMLPQDIENVYKYKHCFPIVVVGDKRVDLDIPTVDVNNYAAGRSLAAYLHDLGHRNIAFISTTLNDNHDARIRCCNGVQHYCYEHGMRLYIYANKVEPTMESAFMDTEYTSGYELTKRCLDECPDTTAVVAINDMVAFGAYKVITELGMRIPQDMSVVAFNNIFPTVLSGLGLTSMDTDLRGCGMGALDLMLEQISGYEAEGEFVSRTNLEYMSSLELRGSATKPRDYKDVTEKVSDESLNAKQAVI